MLPKRVGHRAGQVLEAEHDEADDGVHDDRDRPRRGKHEAVAHHEEREEAHQVKQVEVGPRHGLLEQVDDYRALRAQLQSDREELIPPELGDGRIAVVRVGLHERFHLRQRPGDRQDRPKPSVRDHPLALIDSEQVAPLNDAHLFLCQTCRALQGVILDMRGGVHVAETVPLHIGFVLR